MPRTEGDRMAHSLPGLEEPLLGLDLRRPRPTSFFGTLGRRAPTAYDGPTNIDAVQEGGEDEQGAQLSDRLCLALGLLTNLAQSAPEAKTLVREIRKCPLRLPRISN